MTKVQKDNSNTASRYGMYKMSVLWGIFLPVLFEQLILNMLSIIDTLVASEFSDAATAGISHSFVICNVILMFINGLAVGGSVITAQWFGNKNHERACDSARTSLVLTVAVAAAFCGTMLISPEWTISLLVGKIDADVMAYAVTYYRYSVLSFPMYAIMYVCTSTYRAQGNTSRPMLASVMMFLLSLVFKYTLCFRLHMGVDGTVLSNLISVSCVALTLLVTLRSRKYLVNFCKAGHEKTMLRTILAVAVPNAIENMSVQIGLLIVQRIVAGYGVIESAANGIAGRLQPLSYLPASAWGVVAMVIVGQCCGAGDRELAKANLMRVMKLATVCMFCVNVVILLSSDQIIHWFSGSTETLYLARKLLTLYICLAPFAYMTAYGLPQGLRGGGDARYTMIVSMFAMFGVRMACAILLGTVLGLGVFGVWIAMGIDWIVRSVLYCLRWYKGTWYHEDTIQRE